MFKVKKKHQADVTDFVLKCAKLSIKTADQLNLTFSPVVSAHKSGVFDNFDCVFAYWVYKSGIQNNRKDLKNVRTILRTSRTLRLKLHKPVRFM